MASINSELVRSLFVVCMCFGVLLFVWFLTSDNDRFNWRFKRNCLKHGWVSRAYAIGSKTGVTTADAGGVSRLQSFRIVSYLYKVGELYYVATKTYYSDLDGRFDVPVVVYVFYDGNNPSSYVVDVT